MSTGVGMPVSWSMWQIIFTASSPPLHPFLLLSFPFFHPSLWPCFVPFVPLPLWRDVFTECKTEGKLIRRHAVGWRSDQVSLFGDYMVVLYSRSCFFFKPMLEKSERHLKQLLTPRQLKSSCALCSETVTSPLHDCNHLESLTWRQKPLSSAVCGVKRVFREICIISLHIIVAAWNEIWVFFCDAKPDGGDCSSW